MLASLVLHGAILFGALQVQVVPAVLELINSPGPAHLGVHLDQVIPVILEPELLMEILARRVG
jgi:hypothetical protein